MSNVKTTLHRVPFRRAGIVLSALCFAMALTGVARADDDKDGDPSAAIAQADAAIRAEILKSVAAHKAYMEGLEANRQQQALALRAVNMQADLVQPNGLCQTMETQNALVAGRQAGQSSILRSQRKVLQSVSGNVSTAQTLDAANALSSANFCSKEEVTQGVCKEAADKKYVNLAGADQNAMFLFQARDGTNTYEGVRDDVQVDAVNSYIARVVVGVPPEQLRQRGKATYASNQAARAYTELLRRYNAFLSMSAYSLNQIKESRNPLK